MGKSQNVRDSCGLPDLPGIGQKFIHLASFGFIYENLIENNLADISKYSTSWAGWLENDPFFSLNPPLWGILGFLGKSVILYQLFICVAHRDQPAKPG